MMTIDQIIEQALEEDVREGDHTSLATIPAEAKGKARLLVKDYGVLAGVRVAEKVFQRVDPETRVTVLMEDGSVIRPGDVALEVEGRSVSLLTAERLALNFMQRMSGIATNTSRYVKAVEGLGTKILDTRKTTPNLRIVEKYAVQAGGGENHRFGLFDMIMIKDNHVDFAGGIPQAIQQTKQYLKEQGLDLRIEVEVRDLTELEAVMTEGGIHRIMLDNFDYATLRQAVARINGEYETEASGGITLDTVRAYAQCGVDYISVGALTHQINSLDMSLKAF